MVATINIFFNQIFCFFCSISISLLSRFSNTQNNNRKLSKMAQQQHQNSKFGSLMRTMKKMKRAPSEFLHSDFFADEGASSVFSKQQRLMEDFLELQKEYLSRKKDLHIAKQKKETLLAEVSFLRQKHDSFMVRSFEHEQLTKAKSKPKTRKAGLKSSSPVLHCDTVMDNGEQVVRKKQAAVSKSMKAKKEPKSCLKKKKVGKNKMRISCPDQVAVEL